MYSSPKQTPAVADTHDVSNASLEPAQPEATLPADDQAAPSTFLTQPVATTVASVRTKVMASASAASVHGALLHLEQILPAAIGEQARAKGAALYNVTTSYAQPLMERVDGSLAGAIATVMAAPAATAAYGQAKVVQADALIQAYTPEIAQPYYAEARSKAITVAHSASDKARQLKKDRAQPLMQALSGSISTLQQQLGQLRTALAEAPAEAAHAAAALPFMGRLSELQAQAATALTHVGTEGRARVDQARSLSRDLLHGVSDLTTTFAAYVETGIGQLPESQQTALRQLWTRVTEGVEGLRVNLAQYTAGAAAESDSPARSRSNSVDDSAATEGQVEPAKHSTEDSESKASDKSASADKETADDSADDDHESTADASESAPAANGNATHAKSRAQKRHHKRSKNAAEKKEQKQQEEKSKVEAEQL